MGCYYDALRYYYKEYELIKDVPKEAFTTLYNIAEVSFLAKKPYDQIEKACQDARKAVSDRKLLIPTYHNLYWSNVDLSKAIDLINQKKI